MGPTSPLHASPDCQLISTWCWPKALRVGVPAQCPGHLGARGGGGGGGGPTNTSRGDGSSSSNAIIHNTVLWNGAGSMLGAGSHARPLLN
jgi:hypothetical protein